MSTTTSRLSLTKAEDSDNANTYVKTDVGTNMDTLDTAVTRLNGTNTATSSMTLDMSAASTSTGLKLPQGTSAAPTAEGAIAWDTDDNLLKVGDGAATRTMVATDSTQTLTNKTLTSPSMTSPTVSSGGLTVTAGAISLQESSQGIELGSVSASNTPFIDFHSSGNNIDYDARVLASGGTSTAGNGALVLSHGGSSTSFGGSGGVYVGSPTGTDKGAGTINVASGYYVNGNQIGAVITNSLASDVSLNDTGTFFTGPTVAQGTAGTWFASGSVTCNDSTGASTFVAKLWDGTTVIASAAFDSSGTGDVTIALSGYLASPAANIRISVKDVSHTTGKILFNSSGASKDSTLSAVRVA